MSSPLKSLALGLVLALPMLALAQSQDVPLRIGFQGRLLKDDGTPLNGINQITFSIYDAPSAGTQLWSETQSLLLTNGYYATFLGATTSLGTTDRPATTLFNGADRFLGVTVAGKELTPRQQIGSVGYAIRAAHAVNADSAWSASVADAVKTSWLGSQRVHHADIATSVDGGTVNATTVNASGTVTASTVNASVASATAVSAQNVTVSGTLTVSAANVTALVHVPGAVVGGGVLGSVCTHYSPTYSPSGAVTGQQCDTYAPKCDAWGDGVCDTATSVSCTGGTHPAGYVPGVARRLGNYTLCIQP